MDRFIKIMADFREYRHRTFRSLGELLAQLDVKPVMMTGASLVFGLASAYFLFENYFLFLIFGILHLTADALDGVIASVKGESIFGKYFDHGTDNLIALLLVVKIGYFLQDYYAYIVAGLYLLAQLVYVFSRMNAPILFGRSVSMVALFFYVPATLNFTSALPILVYLFMGVVTVYSLARQLQWEMQRIKI